MLRILAILFGVGFIVIGVLGFVPEYTHDGLFLGQFRVNGWHNTIHIVTGIIGLLCGLGSAISSKVFFIAFGLFYGAFAIWGFYHGEGELLNAVAINTSDSIFHAVIAIIGFYIGVAFKAKR